MKVIFNVSKESNELNLFLDYNKLFLEDIHIYDGTSTPKKNTGIIYKCITNNKGKEIINFDECVGKIYMSIKHNYFLHECLRLEIMMELDITNMEEFLR